MASKQTNDSQMKAVYNIVETNSRKIWVRVGAAFVNRDKSLNVVLNQLPIDGRLHIRDPKPAEEADESACGE